MDNKKEKDEIQEMFSKQLEARENQEIEYEEENPTPSGKVHFTEIISPIVAIILGVMSFFNIFWYLAYFGLIFAVLGLYICKKKGASVGVRILNTGALAICFFLGGLWLMMFVIKKLS